MKSNTKIFGIFILFIVMTVVYLKTTNSKKTDAGIQKEVQLVPEKLIDQAKNHPGLKKAMLTGAEDSSDCKSALESIETLPLKTLLYDLKENKLKLSSDCLFMNFPQSKSLAGFPEVCSVTQKADLSDECVAKIFEYKSLRIHHATKNTDLDTLETAVIIQKFMAVLSDDSMDNSDGHAVLRKIGQKLYERLPESESAAKAAALGFIVSEKLTPEEQAKINFVLDSARSKFPNNWEIYEIDLIRKKGQSLENFKNEILNYYGKFPNSAISQYYMGCLNWSENKAAVARDFFKSATTINSKDTRFTGTYEQSLKTNPPEKVCSLKISFDPDDF
jgi:hypothetical protein